LPARQTTGLTVKAGRRRKVRSGFQYRIEVYYEAVLVSGMDGLSPAPPSSSFSSCP